MSGIERLLGEPAAQAIGWALLHFIWQGTLVGVLTACVLACLRRGAADVRYVVSAISLSLMLTLPIVTAVQLWRTSTGQGVAKADVGQVATTPEAVREQRLVVDQSPTSVASSSAGPRLIDEIRVESWLPVLVLTWLCGVAVLSLRLVSGWVWVQRMKSHGTSPIEDGWDHIAARLSRRLHIARRVRLLKSTRVDVPTVIGWMKPVILVPVSALSGLNPHQLEAILAHELAHIRRHDYLVNLLQTVVETLLFYHPAVWWLSRRIRAERENCCDDLAVSLCGDPLTYAQALADLEGLRGPARQFVMAATGGSLVHRVRRLLGAPSHAGRAPGWLAGSASVLVLLGIAVGAAGTDAFQAAQSTGSTAQSTASTSPASSQQPVRPNDAKTEQQLRDEARAMTAAAQHMAQEAEVLQKAAEAAKALQDATYQATTPFLAGQTLEARASALNETARMMVVEAESKFAAAKAQELVATTLPALSDDSRAMAVLAGETLASTPSRPVTADSSRALAMLDAARPASTPLVQRTVSAAAAVAFSGSQTHATFSYSNNGEKFEVRCDGEVEFTDDDTDVKQLSPGGYLRIRDGGMMTSLVGGHTVEFKADGSGNITRRFWVGSSERPFEPEGHKWLASVLPHFIRQTGIGASARVARILKAKGPSGVLAEISLIDGSWGKRRYFTELLKTTSLDPATVRQLLVQAGHEIDSDFELASLLIDNADKLLVDDATRQAFFDASRSIESDFEMHRVFSTVVKRGTVSPALLASLLNASRNIESDFEEASLLVDVAKMQPLDNATRPAFFGALETVQSDFEHRRVLSALATRGDLPQETVSAMLTSGASVSSDFEAASFLIQVAKQQPIEGSLRAPFFHAVDSIDSAFERGRVLKAVADRPDASAETILAVLHAAKGVNSSFEASQVLLAVASLHPVAGQARDAYIDAAEKLGDFEQGRVLAALVKNERRK
jgi:beta-lactamase regulating signal transducer with metallopeptidase domain